MFFLFVLVFFLQLRKSQRAGWDGDALRLLSPNGFFCVQELKEKSNKITKEKKVSGK